MAVKSALHVAIAFIAFVCAYGLRVEPPIAWWVSEGALKTAGWAVTYATIAAGVEILFRVERSSWRFVSMGECLLMFRSTLFTCGIFLLVLFQSNRAIDLPRTTVILAFVLNLGGLMAARVTRRMIYEKAAFHVRMPFGRSRAANGTTLLLVGSVSEADGFLRALERDHNAQYQAIGILGLNKREVGQEIRGVRVIGTVGDLLPTVAPRSSDRKPPQAVLFLEEPNRLEALPADHLGRLNALGVKLLRLPRVIEMKAEATSPAELREISLEDLLARPAVQLDLGSIRDLIRGKRVLVTGAGGSIGSEICRQVAALDCGLLLLTDSSEFALFRIDREIQQNFPDLARKEILCDVRDRAKVRSWMERERPDIVFHAAALKHVPLVENHPCEGALTNVVGTWNLVECARLFGVGHMVMISTDKAVAPCNVMGATKRIAESLVRAPYSSWTRFSVVRFGNVLGSAGSVVPIFKEQIARGGPVTVTHEEMERFFMTIPEAVQLVLRATAISAAQKAARPRLFVLNMGKPVKIVDLARQMITLSGLRCGDDIEIRYTGLRPGEKLTELLLDENENIAQCEDGVLEVVSSDVGEFTPSRAQIAEIETLAMAGNEAALRERLFNLVRSIRIGAPSVAVTG